MSAPALLRELAAPDPTDPSGEDALEGLTIDGRAVDARVRSALQDAVVEETMDGASTLTLTVWDPDDVVLASGALDHEAVAEVGGLEFALVAVDSQPPILTVTFEDKAVADLRKHKRPMKVARSKKMTRARFIHRLAREVRAERIAFYAPEEAKVQTIAKSQETKSQKAARSRQRKDAFPLKAHVLVKPVNGKNKKANAAQRRVMEEVMQQGVDQGASRDALVGAIECVLQEADAQNLKGGDRDSVGAFQQRASQGWPATRVVKTDAREFFHRFIPALKADKGAHSVGWVVDSVQRSFTVNTPRQGKLYDQWKQIADHDVGLWLGSGGRSGETVRRARYEFTRGQPGQPEDSWTAMGRLAEEVRWRRFMRRGVLYYVSEVWLLGRRARMVIARTLPDDWKHGDPDPTQGVQRLSFNYDTGKPVQTVTAEILAGHWSALPGDRVDVERLGPATGPHLVASARRSLFLPYVTVTLKTATRPLPEPAASIITQTHHVAGTGTPSEKVQAAYKEAKTIDKGGSSGIPYPYVWGGGHARIGHPDGGTGRDPGIGYDCSGSVEAVLAAGKMGFRRGESGPGSGTLMSWGEPGEGKWLTVYANATHTFIEFKVKPGKTEHFGTGDWGKGHGGPGFNPRLHPHRGFVARHWKGT